MEEATVYGSIRCWASSSPVRTATSSRRTGLPSEKRYPTGVPSASSPTADIRTLIEDIATPRSVTSPDAAVCSADSGPWSAEAASGLIIRAATAPPIRAVRSGRAGARVSERGALMVAPPLAGRRLHSLHDATATDCLALVLERTLPVRSSRPAREADSEHRASRADRDGPR